MVARAGGRTEQEVTGSGHRLFLWESDENLLELDSDDGCTTL